MSRPEEDRPPEFWPDGTPKSTGNAFTGHGFIRGTEPEPPPRKNPESTNRAPRAFGGYNGQIPGMGKQ